MRFRIAIAVLFVGLVAAWVSRERPAATVSLGARIEPVASPAQQVAVLRATPAPRFLAFQATPDGFMPVAPSIKEEGRWKNPAKPVEPTFPARFSEAVRVRSGVADVRATPVGGNSASTPRVSEDGSLVYADAFPGCDVKYRCERLKTEEFIVVKDAAAQTTWSWDLELNGLTPRYTPMDTVELIDGNGVPRLRIDAPFGTDAKGKKLRVGESLAFKVDGRRLTLTADLAGCAFPVEIDPSWSSTGSLAIPRRFIEPLVLPDGKVIVVGGDQAFGPALTQCEIFNPATLSWSAAEPMKIGRYYHTVMFLANGEILVTGGNNGSPVAMSEIYSPTSGLWRDTTALPQQRQLHTATLLPDGKVLVVGGIVGGVSADSSCLLYEPGMETWTPTGSMMGPRFKHSATLLPDGKVLVAGGDNNLTSEIYDPGLGTWSAAGSLSVRHDKAPLIKLPNGNLFLAGCTNQSGEFATVTSEIFDVSTATWSLAGSMAVARSDAETIALSSGFVLTTGGRNSSSQELASCEVYNPGTNAWIGTAPIPTARYIHGIARLQNGSVLLVGGNSIAAGGPTAECSLFDPTPSALSQSLSVASGASVNVTLAFDALVLQPTFVVGNPAHGTVTGTAPNLTYQPNPDYVGADAFTFTVNDGFATSAAATVTITVQPSPPVISSGPAATPNPTVPGESVQFSVAATDAQSLTYAWNFGDGSSGAGASPTHTYAAVGEYNAVVTITDAAGTVTTGGVLVKVSSKPMARFTTTDIVAFEDTPFGFDASFSTDPENAIVSYAWDFGDGSPAGNGQIISRTYTQQGSYTVTLTITDAAGQVATTSREIEVLDQGQVGLFNSAVGYSVKWDRGKTNADTLTFSATVNVGATTVGNGSAVLLEIAGSTFTGALDKRLADKTNKNEVWAVKAGTKKQGFGEVALTVKIKKANLGLGFNLAGAVVGNDPKKPVKLEIPVRLEIAGRSFELMLDSEFKFNKTGTSAKGSGEGP